MTIFDTESNSNMFRIMSLLKFVTLMLITVETVVGFCSVQKCFTSVSLNMADSSNSADSSDSQPEYGKSLEIPNTYVRCGRCDTSYALKESDLGEKGRGR